MIALALALAQPQRAAPPPAPPAPPQPAANRRPRAIRPSLFGVTDYPAAALRAGEQGSVAFRLAIDASGRVTDCTVTGSSGSPTLDAATCAIIRERARYAPATDSDGRPTAGTDVGRVTWALPADEPAAPLPQNCVGCRVPRALFSGLFSIRDYPAAALRAREAGRVEFFVVVGADGRVKRCLVTATSGSRALDDTTCAILRARARYRPARDPAGRPVEGVDSGHVDWRLPDPD